MSLMQREDLPENSVFWVSFTCEEAVTATQPALSFAPEAGMKSGLKHQANKKQQQQQKEKTTLCL